MAGLFGQSKLSNTDHFSGNELAFKFGKIDVVIKFREGGACDVTERIKAMAGGGVVGENLFEPTEVTGVISADFTLISALTEAYKRKGPINSSSAVHSSFTSQGAIRTNTFFDQAVVSAMPTSNNTEYGGKGLYTVTISLASPTDRTVEQMKV